jgi:hypothetical protein
MTMIVGATVINLKDLVGWAETQFSVLTAAIVNSGDTLISEPVQSSAPGALLVLPFMVAGFLHLYLWARRYLPREWRDADDELYAKKVEELAERQEQQEQKLDQIKSKLFAVDPNLLKPFQDTARRLNVDQTIIDEVVTRYRNAKNWSDDPIKGFGSSVAEGFQLSASVVATGDEQYPYNVSIGVSRTDQQSFSAAIVLLYHNSFDNPVEVEGHFQGAKYAGNIWATEGFTLGALVVVDESHQTIRLALDLDSLANLPAGFKSSENEE